MRFAIALVLLPALASAQPFPPVRAVPSFPSPELAAFLQLTPDQVERMKRNEADLAVFALAKVRRQIELQAEIAAETARTPLDPSALGMRYAELETNCREVNEERRRAQERHRGVLTDPQKVRLKTLEDALKLMSLATESAAAGLIEGVQSTVPSQITSIRSGFPVGLGAFPAPGSCPVPGITLFGLLGEPAAAQ